MRTALAIFVILALASLAHAQGQAPGPSGCFAPGGGFGGGGGGSPPPGGPRGNGTRGGGNFSRGEPLADLNLTLDPPGEVTLAPGASASLALVLRNDGAGALALNLTARGLNATIDPAMLTLDAGASARATLTFAASADAPSGCRQLVNVRAGEAGTNRSAQTRVFVVIAEPAPASPASASTPEPAKASPAHGAFAALVGLAGAALLAGRRR